MSTDFSFDESTDPPKPAPPKGPRPIPAPETAAPKAWPHPAPAGNAPAAEDGPIPFGVVGRNRLEHTGGGYYKVVRDLLGAGVRYRGPTSAPAPDEPVWRELGQHFEMLLPKYTGSLTQPGLKDLGVCSLLELGKELQARPPQGPKDPNLLLLDGVSRALLERVQALHEAGYGLGLLNPEGVLALKRPERVQVILPDLGFVREGQAFGPSVPWLDDKGTFASRWRPLWGTDPKTGQPFPLGQLQSVGDVRYLGSRPVEEPGPDLRKVARLFAWLLTGKAQEEPPAPEQFPHDRRLRQPVWKVLDRVALGEIASAAEFRQELEQHPLSSHFFGSRVRRPLALGRLAGPLCSLVLLAGLAWGWWQWRHHLLGGTPTAPPVALQDARLQPAEPLPAGSRLQQPLQQYRQAATRLDKFAGLKALYLARLSQHDREREVECLYREHTRFRFLREQQDRLKELNYDREDLIHFHECLVEVQEILDCLTKLHPYPVQDPILEEEKRCSDECRIILNHTPGA